MLLLAEASCWYKVISLRKRRESEHHVAICRQDYFSRLFSSVNNAVTLTSRIIFIAVLNLLLESKRGLKHIPPGQEFRSHMLQIPCMCI